MKKSVLFLIAVGIVTTGSLVAQATPKTLEELYLEGQNGATALSLVATDDADMQVQGLAVAEAILKSSADAAEKELAIDAALIPLRQGVLTVSRNHLLLPDSYRPIVRVKAVETLGYAQGGRVDAALREVLRHDPEVFVAIAAAVALAERDLEVKGAQKDVLTEIALVLRKEVATRMDHSMITGLLYAIEILGPQVRVKDQVVRESLMDVVLSGAPNHLKQRAAKVSGSI